MDLNENQPTARFGRFAYDYSKMFKQHQEYARMLTQLGVRVEYLPCETDPRPGLFIDHAAVLLAEVAVVARAGSVLVRHEADVIAEIFGRYRPVQRIVDPALLDGRDVVKIGRTLYVSESSSTNTDGILALKEIVEPFGYDVRGIELGGGDHLKSAFTFIPPHFVVLNPAWVVPSALGNFTIIRVHEDEPLAANTLTVARTTLVNAAFPKTETKLRDAGIATRAIDLADSMTIGGGVTSLSLVWESRSATASAEVGLKIVEAPNVPLPVLPSAQAITHGGLLFVSPQTPFDLSFSPVPEMSVEEQAENVMSNIAVILATAGSSLARVIRATVHVADAKIWPQIAPVYLETFGAHRPICILTTNGALPSGVSVQVEVIAAMGDSG